jgi:hypothetical protein
MSFEGVAEGRDKFGASRNARRQRVNRRGGFECEILALMVHTSILTDDFVEAASHACWRARQAALAAGYPVVFVDTAGRCVEEWPDGKRFEIRLDPTQPRATHRIVLRELASNAT